MSGPYTATAGQTVFDYDFPITHASEIVVRRLRGTSEIALELDVDYGVTGVGAASGTIILTDVALDGDVVTLYGKLPIERVTNFSGFRSIPNNTINTELDRMTMSLQEMRRDVDTSIKTAHAGQVYDVNGRRIINVADGIDDGDAATIGQLKPFADAAAAAQVAAEAARDVANAARDAAAAEAEEAAAARDAAIDAAAAIAATEFISRAWVVANLHPVIASEFIRTAGYAAPGDGGGAFYMKVNAEPSHSGKFSILLADGATVIWYELTETRVRPEMFGAGLIGNNATALQAMFTYGSPEVYLPRGVWRSDSALTRSTDIAISGPGTLDFSQGTSGQLLIAGSVTTLAKMNADVAKHATTLSFAAAPAVAPGDVLILYNPTDYSFGGVRAEYRDGGMFKVHSLSGNNVLVYEKATDAYVATAMNVGKLNGVRVSIDGIRVVPCSTAQLAPICVQFGQDVRITNVKCLAGGTYGGILADRCYNVFFEDVTPENNSPHVDNEYGIILASCHHASVRGGAGFATRHAVVTGTNGQPWSVPCRHVSVSNMSLWNHPATDIGAADVHGNGDFITYSNCVMGGFSGGGRNIRLVGCTIFGMKGFQSGMCVNAPELNGGYFEILDCDLISEGDGSYDSHAYILLQPIGSGGFGYPAASWTRENLSVRIANLRLVTPNASTLAKALSIFGGNADKKTNVVIDGLEWIAPQGLAFLYATDQVAVALASDRFIVDNVVGPSGAYLIYPDAKIAAVPTREMAQRGDVTLSLTTSAALFASATTAFRYKYSRLPSMSVDVSSVSGAAKSLFGGKNVTAFIYAKSALNFQGAVRSVDAANFATAEDIAINWTAGIQGI